MNSEMKQVDECMSSVEVSIEYEGQKLSVVASDWLEAIVKLGVGKLKTRIASIARYSVEYDFRTKNWFLVFPKSLGEAKDRILLALLFAFPKRMSREQLSIATGIEKSSLDTYLSKFKPEVLSSVDKEEIGVILNEDGYQRAVLILESFEPRTDMRKDDDSVE